MSLFINKGYESYAPDMPGFGASFHPSEDPNAISWYSDLYATVFSVMPAFKDGCHLVGHHSGGVIGTEMNLSHPELIRSLTIVGPALMDATERNEMRQHFLFPFNEPVEDGSHLLKTWEYVNALGIPKQSTELLHRETLDHVRAWKGRSQIYSCVWDYDSIEAFKKITCPILTLCAEDDVLWPYIHYVKELRPDVSVEEIVGANFGLDQGARDIKRHLLKFLQSLEGVGA
jgi:pimeloyl-ACP methyl ester carboxylesterase